MLQRGEHEQDGGDGVDDEGHEVPLEDRPEVGVPVLLHEVAHELCRIDRRVVTLLESVDEVEEGFTVLEHPADVHSRQFHFAHYIRRALLFLNQLF